MVKQGANLGIIGQFRLLTAVVFGLFTILNPVETANAQTNGYKITLEINEANESAATIKVKQYVPKQTTTTCIFVFPIAGYGNAGRLKLSDRLSLFRAIDQKGKKLKIETFNNDGFTIFNATELQYIEYEMQLPTNDPAPSAATFIDNAQKKAWLIYARGCLGYLYQYPDLPVELTVIKPKGYYGATGLANINSTDTSDIFTADSFINLAQHPILYALPDTMGFTLGQTRFTLAVYSTGNKLNSKKLFYTFKRAAKAASNFLGGFEVKQYTCSLFFNELADSSLLDARGHSANKFISAYGGVTGGMGAFFVLPDITKTEHLLQRTEHVFTHELLHTFLPYHLFSAEAACAGFCPNTPPTKLLWLYEGFTEYFTLLALLREKQLTEHEFFYQMGEYLFQTQQYPDVSLTETSAKINTKKSPKWAMPMLYHKGAAVAFLLDAQLQHNKQISLIELLQKMAKKQKNQPFDETLLPEIWALLANYPEIIAWYNLFIAGRQPLPINEILLPMGLSFHQNYTDTLGTYGKFWITPNYKQKSLHFVKVKANNLNVKNNDQLLSINGEPLTIALFGKLQYLLYNPQPTDTIHLSVKRQTSEIQITAPAQTKLVRRSFIIKKQKKPTVIQAQNLNLLLFGATQKIN
ncbi:MAG: hypothetical protein IPI59_14575 [Sphingobacteriales bacterium]|jgi:predicted metalloprotease with PDZ domain|nr:hypothetical protein [Sphingobacteriales bacterium]MBP9142689.1 hypothetical protein [Chitinophagales bacterium]MDA0199789.1 hypothetical protein [Bacteroidota bacterium]MBK7528733.1 hypothetical protein [Sphingobacteriales bacterium]MBL0246834.1 hypothetical protein [Sphingobacteriales bacterium]